MPCVVVLREGWCSASDREGPRGRRRGTRASVPTAQNAECNRAGASVRGAPAATGRARACRAHGANADAGTLRCSAMAAVRTSPAPCAVCGSALRPDAHFCDACGAAVLVESRKPVLSKGEGLKVESPRVSTGALARSPTRSPAAYTPRHLADKILHIASPPSKANASRSRCCSPT